jgi:hypothetical protein
METAFEEYEKEVLSEVKDLQESIKPEFLEIPTHLYGLIKNHPMLKNAIVDESHPKYDESVYNSYIKTESSIRFSKSYYGESPSELNSPDAVDFVLREKEFIISIIDDLIKAVQTNPVVQVSKKYAVKLIGIHWYEKRFADDITYLPMCKYDFRLKYIIYSA